MSQFFTSGGQSIWSFQKLPQKIKLREFPGGPVVRTPHSPQRARVWSLVGGKRSHKPYSRVTKKKKKNQAQNILHCCTNQIPTIWHERFPPGTLFQNSIDFLLLCWKYMFSTEPSSNRIFCFKKDWKAREFRNWVLPEQMLHFWDLKKFSNMGIKAPLSDFLPRQFVREIRMKSRVASPAVVSCVPLVANLYSCGLRHFLFISSVLASSQLEQINEERLNKTLKKLNTVQPSHPCSLIYPKRVYDCLEVKAS